MKQITLDEIVGQETLPQDKEKILEEVERGRRLHMSLDLFERAALHDNPHIRLSRSNYFKELFSAMEQLLNMDPERIHTYFTYFKKDANPGSVLNLIFKPLLDKAQSLDCEQEVAIQAVKDADIESFNRMVRASQYQGEVSNDLMQFARHIWDESLGKEGNDPEPELRAEDELAIKLWRLVHKDIEGYYQLINQILDDEATIKTYKSSGRTRVLIEWHKGEYLEKPGNMRMKLGFGTIGADFNGVEKIHARVRQVAAESIAYFSRTCAYKELVPLKDEEYRLIEQVLKSKYSEGKDTKSMVVSLLGNYWLRKDHSRQNKHGIMGLGGYQIFKPDFKRTEEVLLRGEADTLLDVLECGQIQAEELFIKVLGRGLKGTTYLAYSEDSDEEYAIKLVPKREFNPDETKSLAKCRHPNIVNLRYVRKTNIKNGLEPMVGIVMDYVGGQTIGKIVQENPDGLETEKLLRYAEQLVVGIHHIHKSGRYHRDIHLKNLKIDEFGYLKILDFGTATTDMEAVHEKNRSFGGNNDLVSAGQIIYKMATGNNLFKDGTKTKKDDVKTEREQAYANEQTKKDCLCKVRQEVKDPMLADIICDLLDDDLWVQPDLEAVEEAKAMFGGKYD